MDKCFDFEIVVRNVMRGYVYAKNETEARKLIANGEWEDADYIDSPTIKSIKELTEDKTIKEE